MARLRDKTHALFSMVNIIRDGTRRLKVPERFKDGGVRCFERFSYLKFSLGKLNSPVCSASESERSE